MKAGEVVRIKKGNKKLGKVLATFAPIRQTCPDSCSYKLGGCYILAIPATAELASRFALNAIDRGLNELDIAHSERRMIAKTARTVRRGTALRLHEAGDCKTEEAAKIVAKGAAAWPGPVWSYSHAWRDVPRAAWGTIKVFASCETEADAVLATSRGYAPAIIVPEFPNGSGAWTGESGIRWTPCPAETEAPKEVTCATCGFCFDDRERSVHDEVGRGIAFKPHGRDQNRVRETLETPKRHLRVVTEGALRT